MKIALLGDIALYGKYSIENQSIFSYLDEIKKYLSNFDYVIGNLETPFSEGEGAILGKSANIKAGYDSVKVLKYLGVNIVNLANNHMFDYGEKAFFSTLEILEKNDIQFFGINNQVLEVCFSSNKIALHGYCSYNTNPSGIYGRGKSGVTALNVKCLLENMRRNHDNDFLNIISIHSGQEHVNYPSLDDIKMARLIANQFPHVYYGHHPHVVQGTEEKKGSLIAYSLGNFLFDDVYTKKSKDPLIKQSENNKTGMILELEINANKVTRYAETLIYQDLNSLRILDKKDKKDKKAYDLLKLYSEEVTNALKGDRYQNNRNLLIEGFINKRKKMRNAMWYFSRLNLNSLAIIKNARRNQNKYNENVTNYL